MKNDFFEYIDKYFNTHLVNEISASNKTIENYKYTFKLLFRYMSEKCNLRTQDFNFDKFTKEFVIDFLSWIEYSRNNNINSRNLRLASIKSFVSFIVQYEVSNIELIKILKIPRKKVAKVKPSVLSEAEIELLLRQPNTSLKKGRRKLAILSLLYDAGLRIDELLSLKVKDLKFERINTVIVWHGKGNKKREIPISDDVTNILRIYLKDYNLFEDDLLFSNSKKEKLSSNAIRKIIKENVELAKKENDKFPNKVNPHKFRHTKATHLVDKGVSILEVKEFLGHSDLSSTQIYVTTNLLKKREALTTIEYKLDDKKSTNIASKGSEEWLNNIIH